MSVVECFPIGSVVACTTCFNENIEGSVMAFDPAIKMLILKCPAESGNKKFNDVYLVNLDLCRDVQVKKEVMATTTTTPNQPPQSLNLQRLSTRIRNAVEQKKRLVSALTAGVSPEGQKLFLAIAKTIAEVAWQGPTIVVLGDTYIVSPYTVDNVSGKDERRVNYIKKIVESHRKEANAASSMAVTAISGTATPPPSSSTSSPSNASSSASTTIITTTAATCAGGGTTVKVVVAPTEGGGAAAGAASSITTNNNTAMPATTTIPVTDSVNSAPTAAAAAASTAAAGQSSSNNNTISNNQPTPTATV